MSDYLFCQTGARSAAWHIAPTPPPPDAGSPAAVPAVAPSWPDRAGGVLRAAVVAYVALVSGVPPDAVATPIAATSDDAGRYPCRAAAAAYAALSSATPQDAGTTPIASQAPDRATAYRRAAADAYAALASASPRDAGTLSIAAVTDDIGRASRRAAGVAYTALASASPRDAGSVSIAAQAPDRATAPRRADAVAYAGLASATPRDAGTTPIVSAVPDRATGPQRAAPPSYFALASPIPPDAGIAPSPPIPAALPTQVATRPRAGWYEITSGTPPDQGTILIPPAIAPAVPDRAMGPQRAARSAHIALISATPPDAGTPPIPAALPIQAATRARAGWYATTAGTPLDQGTIPVPPAVAPAVPDRAMGPQRAARSAYVAMVSTTPLAASGLSYNIYSNTGVGDPINYLAAIATVDGTTWTTPPLAAPGTWSFGVRALNAYGEEQNVDVAVTFALDAMGLDVSNIPAAPVALSAIPRAGGVVAVEWAYPLATSRPRAPTGFHVYRGTGGSADYTAPVATVAAGQSGAVTTYSAVITGLAGGVIHSFGVRAFNGVGEESNVRTASATVRGSGPLAVVGLTAITTS